MKIHWPNKQPVSIGSKDDEITVEQWDTLEELQRRHNIPDPMEVILGGGYIGVMAGRMFIGVETDGHSHT